MIPHPRVYACQRASSPPPIDGSLEDPVWASAAWTEDFLDIEGPGHPRQPWHRTRAKMLWDDRALYIGAELEEPHLWATLTERDSVIFQDNDFEAFIDPDDDGLNYVELEVNALNTVWDLRLAKPYRFGGDADNAFQLEGLQTAVRLNGSLNDPTDTDRGWSVTIAIPWRAFAPVTSAALPPLDGDRWRINFSRVQWDLEVVQGAYRKIANRPEHNWVWSPQFVIDMHRPRRWGYLEFQSSPREPSTTPDWDAFARQLVD